MRQRLEGLLIGAVIALGACGSDNGKGGTAGSGGAAGSGGGGAGAAGNGGAGAAGSGGAGAGMACNSLTNDAPAVALRAMQGSVPAATGGAVADGTYKITGAVIYGLSGVPDGPIMNTDPVRGKLQIMGDVAQTVSKAGSDPEERSTGHFRIMGTQIVSTETCPGTKMETQPFDANPTTIVLQQAITIEGTSATLVVTYSK